MSLGSFLKLVEIQTKVASVIPLFLGTVYTLYHYKTFNMKNFLFMLASLLCVDMATTAINNYQDFKRASIKKGYGYERHNAIVRDNLGERAVLTVIAALLAAGVIFGILLFINTDIIVLVLGMLSFAIGIIYTSGPLPISRTPFGEILSGSFMGFIITFLAIYIHTFDRGIAGMVIKDGMLNVKVNLFDAGYILLLSIPAVVGIANIMLANNICDMEEDSENKRYTLPLYIGKGMSLVVFEMLYYIGFAAVAVLLVLRVLPMLSVLVLGTLFPVYKNIRAFHEKQTKKDTFVLAVKNFVLVNLLLVVTIVVSCIF